MNKNHIGQSFDLFLKEENIEISEEEIKKNSLIYGFTCLDDKGKIIPNYKIFQIDNELVVEESEEEIRERLKNMFKDKCMEFLQKKFEPTNENYLKEQFEGVLKEAYDKGTIISDYKIKRTKLPRKLKKKYKKEQRICFDIEYRQPQRIEFAIPIEESEDEK